MSHVGSRVQVFGPSSATFPRLLGRSWIWNGATGIWTRWWLDLVHQNANFWRFILFLIWKSDLQREGKRESLSISGSLPRWLLMARRAEPKPGTSSRSMQVQEPKDLSRLPLLSQAHLAGSWIQSGATRNQNGTSIGFQHCKWKLSMLYIAASLHLLTFWMYLVRCLF